MHHPAFRLTAALCAAAFAFAAAPAQDQITLQYKLPQGATYRFSDSVVANASQEMMGRQVKSTSKVTAVSRVDVAEVRDDGAMVLVIAPESMKLQVKSPQGDTTLVPQELIGKRSRLEISRLGETLQRQSLDSVKIAGLAAMAGQRELIRFHVYPSKPVKIGDTWTATRPDTTESMGGQMVSNSTFTYKAAAKEKKLGRNCVKVTYTAKTAINGKGTMMGSSFFVEGSGTVSGAYWADPTTGLPVLEDATTNMESTVAVTGQQTMTIPSSQAVTTHRVLLAGKP